jgi:hypothetical protein
VLQASIGQLREAHTLFGDYIAAFSHFGWIPEQVSVLLNQVATLSLLKRVHGIGANVANSHRNNSSVLRWANVK